MMFTSILVAYFLTTTLASLAITQLPATQKSCIGTAIRVSDGVVILTCTSATNKSQLLYFADNGTQIGLYEWGTTASDKIYGTASSQSTNEIFTIGRTTGSFGDQVNSGLTDIQVSKILSNGSLAWVMIYGSAQSDSGFDVATFESMNLLFATGDAGAAFDGQAFTGSGSAVFVTTIAFNGTRLSTRFTQRSSGDCYGSGVTLYGSSGDLIITGSWGNQGFVSRYSSTVNAFLWTSITTASGNAYYLKSRIEASTGMIYVCGSFYGTIDGVASSPFDTDMLVTRYFDNGTREAWSWLYGTASDDEALDFALDQYTTKVAVVGSWDDDIDITYATFFTNNKSTLIHQKFSQVGRAHSVAIHPVNRWVYVAGDYGSSRGFVGIDKDSYFPSDISSVVVQPTTTVVTQGSSGAAQATTNVQFQSSASSTVVSQTSSLTSMLISTSSQTHLQLSTTLGTSTNQNSVSGQRQSSSSIAASTVSSRLSTLSSWTITTTVQSNSLTTTTSVVSNQGTTGQSFLLQSGSFASQSRSLTSLSSGVQVVASQTDNQLMATQISYTLTTHSVSGGAVSNFILSVSNHLSVTSPQLQSGLTRSLSAFNFVPLSSSIVSASLQQSQVSPTVATEFASLLANQTLLLIVAGAVALLLIVCIGCFTWFLCRHRNLPKPKTVAQKSFTQLLLQQDQVSEKATSYATSFNTSLQTAVVTQHELSVPSYLECEYGRDFMQTELIAKGGFGAIYHCRIMNMSRFNTKAKLVVKNFGTDVTLMTEELRISFYQELSMMWMLRDQLYFARLFAYCEVPAAIVMKYYTHGSLKHFAMGSLAQTCNMPYTSQQITLIMLQTCKALTFLHSKQFAHRDVKPDNILLELDEQTNLLQACITDFGVSRLLDHSTSQIKAFQISLIRGASTKYAAPEVFSMFKSAKAEQQAPVGVWKAGDIYALGVMLFEVLSRRRVWDKKSQKKN